MRVCLDANVLVSAFGTRGLSADVVRVVLAEHELIVPAVVIPEVRRALREKFRLPDEVLDAVEQLLRSRTVVPKPEQVLATPVRDPDDAWVLASAVAGRAEVLVTGDADLLEVPEPPLPVLAPRAFWQKLRGEADRPGKS